MEVSRASGFGKFEMGSDPFNLMPIIEQLQAKRRKKTKRARRIGGPSLCSSHSSSRVTTDLTLPELGKRFDREEEDVLAPSGSRRKIMVTMDDLSLSTEVDGVQPCRS